MNSIWSSVEADAWSRNFGYVDYLHIHNELKIKGEPLDQDGYDALCNLLDNQMEDFFK